MASFTKFNAFVEHLAEGVHNLGSDQLVIALVNSPAPAATNSLLADLTEISYTNLSSRNVTLTSSTQTSGTYKLGLADLTISNTHVSASAAPFRYVVLYNDGTTVAVNPLIGWYDYGSSVTLAAGETFTIDFDASAGVLTIA